MRTYKVISLTKLEDNYSELTRTWFDVKVVNPIDNSQLVLKNISLPTFVKINDLICRSEHRFFDVIDKKGNLLYR
ncbi:hypothetical protein MY04_5505 [Flammeovirga sp. MY04]|uniref:hypothetical protein n=1 Tax=Flammeovirga sp. MY04 TaxID=1191459 RepID=UPI000806195D|nr:hypothetical protein [Flammeovirga sp. MY04]ANQ52836.1 hypothetical protein MY04_5505 [Flammeovirga sp. MY04]